MIDLDRLRNVLDAYGAEPERWPAEERDGLQALVSSTPEAETLVREAARLDALLDRASPAPDSSALLARRVLDQAPTPARRASSRGWRVALPIAAAAALALWLGWDAQAPQTPSPIVAQETLPQEEIALADLGVYTTSTDVLLSLDGSDPFLEGPDFGCEEGQLGCLDLEVVPAPAAKSARAASSMSRARV